MPSRRREQMVLLVGLVVLNALLGWDLHRRWRDYQKRTQWIDAPVAPGSASTPSARPRTARTQSFAEIVSQNMFTQERTSQSPQEEVKAPPLPFLWGTMNLGTGWFALMAPGDQAPGLSQRVVVGQEIGGYKLVSISGSQVVVDWGGKNFNINTADSVRRAPRSVANTARPETPAGGRTTASPTSAGDAGRVTTVAPASPTVTPFSAGAQKGKTGAAGAAPPGAPPDAPPGAIFGGKRKVVTPTPFGDSVYWVDAEPAQKPAGEESKEP
jgi:hypothetical protein